MQPSLVAETGSDPDPDLPTRSRSTAALMDEVPICCQDCQQRWGWPRNIRYLNVAEGAKTIKPTTKETIVPYLAPDGDGKPSICSDVFSRLHFVRKHRRCLGKLLGRTLVTEFEYQKSTGVVYYDVHRAAKPDIGYARLISLNSWWWDLSKALATASLGFFELGINTSLIFNMWSDDSQNTMNIDGALFVRSVYTYGYTVLFFCMLLLASNEARKEWRIRSQPRIGDITLLPGKLDSWKCFMALTMLVFFGVDVLVRDIIITLHPWKGVQPFAAIKSYGTRAHVVGYRNAYHFYIENQGGQNVLLPAKLLMIILTTSVKVWTFMTLNYPYYMTWPVFTSMCSFLYSLVKFIQLLRARRAWFKLRKKNQANAARSQIGATGRSGAADSATPSVDRKLSPIAASVSIQGTTSQVTALRQKWAAYHQKWREEAFERRHFTLGFGLGADMTYNFDEGHECNLCGRDLLTDEDKIRLERAEVVPPGMLVRLVRGALENPAFSDARHGPLRDNEVGIVIDVSKSNDNYGARLLVEPLKMVRDLDADSRCSLGSSGQPGGARWEQHCWWYDAAALESSEPVLVQPRNVVLQDLDKSVRKLRLEAHNLRTLMQAAPGAESLKAKMSLKQVLDPLLRLTNFDREGANGRHGDGISADFADPGLTKNVVSASRGTEDDGQGDLPEFAVSPRTVGTPGSSAAGALMSEAEIRMIPTDDEDTWERSPVTSKAEIDLRQENQRLQDEIKKLQGKGAAREPLTDADKQLAMAVTVSPRSPPQRKEEKQDKEEKDTRSPRFRNIDLKMLRQDVAMHKWVRGDDIVRTMQEVEDVMEALKVQWWQFEHQIALETVHESASLRCRSLNPKEPGKDAAFLGPLARQEPGKDVVSLGPLARQDTSPNEVALGFEFPEWRVEEPVPKSTALSLDVQEWHYEHEEAMRRMAQLKEGHTAAINNI